MGSRLCYQYPRGVPLLQVRREADDQTGPWGEDHRVLLFSWETRCVIASHSRCLKSLLMAQYGSSSADAVTVCGDQVCYPWANPRELVSAVGCALIKLIL